MLDHNTIFAGLDALSTAKTDTDFFAVLEQYPILLDPDLDSWLDQFIVQAQTEQKMDIVTQFQQMQLMLKDIREQCTDDLSNTQELMQAIHAIAVAESEAEALKILADHPILKSPDTYTFLDKIIPEMEAMGATEQVNLFKHIKGWLLELNQPNEVH